MSHADQYDPANMMPLAPLGHQIDQNTLPQQQRGEDRVLNEVLFGDGIISEDLLGAISNLSYKSERSSTFEDDVKGKPHGGRDDKKRDSAGKKSGKKAQPKKKAGRNKSGSKSHGSSAVDSSVEASVGDNISDDSREEERPQRLSVKTSWCYEPLGDNEHFDSFYERTTGLFDLARVPKSQRYDIILQLLAKNYMWIARDVDRKQIKTLRALVEHLRERLSPPSKVMSHRMALARCRQRDHESVAEFAAHIKQLCFAAYPTDERVRGCLALSSFISGLKNSLVVGLTASLAALDKRDHRKSFAEIKMLAEALEEVHSMMRGGDSGDYRRTINAVNAQDGAPTIDKEIDPLSRTACPPLIPPDCNRTLSDGTEVNANFQAPQEQNNQSGFGPALRNKPLLGYTSADIHRQRQRLPQGSPRQPRRCFRCNSEQHLIRECPVLPPAIDDMRTVNRAVRANSGQNDKTAVNLAPFFF